MTISIGAMPHSGMDAKTASPFKQIHAYMNDAVLYDAIVEHQMPACPFPVDHVVYS